MNNAELTAVGSEYVMNTYARYPLALVRGKGSKIWDADGKEYLDFIGGIAVCVLGHSDQRLNKALQEQSEKLWHCSNLFWIEPQIELAKKLVQNSGLSKAFFCNSGAEANEAAIKMVRKYFYRRGDQKRHSIIVFKNSFHGRTMAALTATGQPKYHEGFAPLVPGFAYADFNDLNSVKALINDETAAVMVEPIQGEGGVTPADIEFLQGLRQICDQKGLVLIFDEVQCGIGRSGHFFTFQKYGVKPDIVTLAKGIAGGFPMGVMLAGELPVTGFEPGDHASTFGGNPLGTAVGNAVFDIVGQEDFLQQVRDKGKYLQNNLQALKDKRITELRGLGLMLGLEMNANHTGLLEICRRKGLLLIGAGPKVVRWVPALNISETEMKQAVEIFAEALDEWPED
ncbi:MAG: aspartate aminotransferase family protein [Syntrophomonadaceae bacterium]|jgi:predicted acetylornithine/succinylornithine family transaminase|nr:aspartate aminotransferase family protein [Syntrophomonadaceae bacterium]